MVELVISPFDAACSPTPLTGTSVPASCDSRTLLVSVLVSVLVKVLARVLARERSKSISLT
jgi:hypothetical protein